ncbi:MAG: DEAD/DEAH box helicase family protein [Oscillospiraceae bacterium]|nr:DEAD/DEAH box helicase family protein [Oscillospiraceae bacterium]
MATMVENKNCYLVKPADKEPPQLYPHQTEALNALDSINRKDSFKTIVVLPTGGGKTLTAVYWLLKNAVDNGKNVLWLAHRSLLLEQAADTFIRNASTKIMVNHTGLKCRIVSGKHDSPVNIENDDNILICGKDSIARRPEQLDEWLKGEDIYFVIDEAHHAVARSYRKIIDHVFEHAGSVKMLGLTATPFRTNEKEKGALLKIFEDDICYSVDLNTLIKNTILAYPIPINCDTKQRFSGQLGVKDIKAIQNFDQLPTEIAEYIASNKERNAFIVKTYVESREKFGQTIVFAVNKDHAFALSGLFKKSGIAADYIVSDTRDGFTGITISDKENDRKIKQYKNGKLEVLINVNILTEGTDLPQTHTVFLARPTTSKVLMTQMVGRALRGEKAGGTKEAYIVSFIDDWDDKIAWESPEELDNGDPEWNDAPADYNHKQLHLISISLIEEFARIADDNVDTSAIENIPSIERIPIGMYVFETFRGSHQILVYNSNEEIYKNLIEDLPKIFDIFDVDDEEIPDQTMSDMVEYCRDQYFGGAESGIFPPFSIKDIIMLLQFYAEKASEPEFIKIDEIDRNKLDAATAAREIIEKDMRRSKESAFIQGLWDTEPILKIFYRSQLIFKKMIETELYRMQGDFETSEASPDVTHPKIDIAKLPLHEIKFIDPAYYSHLTETVYSAAKNEDGDYVCARCGEVFSDRRFLQIDHIKAMANGGLTVLDNLQVLCRKCNGEKGDKE